MATLQYSDSGFSVPPHNIAVATNSSRTNLYILELKTPNADLPAGNALNTDALVLAAGGILVASIHYDASGNTAVIYNQKSYY